MKTEVRDLPSTTDILERRRIYRHALYHGDAPPRPDTSSLGSKYDLNVSTSRDEDGTMTYS
jgi:hypothetical protein